jgi:hypothetical protein
MSISNNGPWEPKMNPITCKEDLSGGLNRDSLLARCQNCHLRELINDHEDTIIPILGQRKTRHVIHVYRFP